MDSAALAYWKRPDYSLTIDYGQLPAQGEIQAAEAICATLGLRHHSLRIDCSALGSGDLVGQAPLAVAPVAEWWPFRNQLLVTIAASHLIRFDVSHLLIGCVSTDSTHADGGARFVERLSELLNLQEGGMRLSAPASDMSSVQLVRESRIPLEVLAWAHSCHVSNLACGFCRGCSKHFQTTSELGIGAW